jgi:predicted GNAT superfamily acetyltransferase
MSWDLTKKIQRPAFDLDFLLAAETRVLGVETVRIQGKTSPVELEVVRKLNLDLSGDFLLVQIPKDFYRMLRETDIPDESVRRIPLDWRLATRQAFQTLFARNYEIVDFQKSGKRGAGNFYVMKKIA